MKIKHLFVSILLATGFQPMIAQSALFFFFIRERELAFAVSHPDS